MNKFTTLLFAGFFAANIGASLTGGPQSARISAQTVAVTGITLNAQNIELPLNGSYQLVATVEPPNATDKTVTNN